MAIGKNAILSTGLALLLAAPVISLVTTQRYRSLLNACRALDQPPVRHGVLLPPLTGLDNYGQPLTVGYDAVTQPTLVLYYSPSCGYCEENWPAWDTLLAAARQSAVRVVAIDPSGLTDDAFLRAHDMPGATVFRRVNYITEATYGLTATPTTLLIQADGLVEAMWRGVLDDIDLESARRLIVELGESTGQ